MSYLESRLSLIGLQQEAQKLDLSIRNITKEFATPEGTQVRAIASLKNVRLMPIEARHLLRRDGNFSGEPTINEQENSEHV